MQTRLMVNRVENDFHRVYVLKPLITARTAILLYQWKRGFGALIWEDLLPEKMPLFRQLQ